jgi:hypothetical protein
VNEVVAINPAQIFYHDFVASGDCYPSTPRFERPLPWNFNDKEKVHGCRSLITALRPAPANLSHQAVDGEQWR